MTAVTAGARRGGETLLQQSVEVLLRALLVLVERVHELRCEDLLGARVHLLLAGREALLHLAQRQVANDLGELEDVAGLDLLAVVLETPVPVLRHLGHVVGEDGCDLLDFFLVDDAAQAGFSRVLAGDHHREFVVKDLDREVLTLDPHQLAGLFRQHQASPVMGVDDLVALLEVADVNDVLLEDRLDGLV
jgi:hypothetical protein